MSEPLVSGWGVVLAALCLTHVTILGVTLYLHRSQTHRALDMHPALAHFFRAWLWLTTGMITREWVSIHRRHHARCETEDDPHSPQIKGIWRILFLGVVEYVKASKQPEIMERYGHGTPDDWVERNVYSRFPKIGVTLMALIDMAVFGPLVGMAVWAVQMLWIPFWAAGVVNGVGHFWGYRNFDPADASRNIFPVGLIIGGEEMHNNHHTYPTSAKFSVRPFEFDIGWGYIRIFQALGLVTVKKLPPVFHASETPVGDEAVSQRLLENVVAHRFEVLAEYSKVLKALYAREKPAIGQAGEVRRGLWGRLGVLQFSKADAKSLEAVKSASPALARALELREHLIQVWANQKASKAESLAALKAWLESAQASNISELVGFSNRLVRMV